MFSNFIAEPEVALFSHFGKIGCAVAGMLQDCSLGS
jgi:hypothetical protein